MAIKLPKFLTGTDAKSRIVLLFTAIAGFFFLVYLGVSYIGGGSKGTTGPTKVAEAPTNLKSVPGSELTPEYYRALTQANEQAAQQAQMTGSSAVPTLINVPTQTSTAGGGDCTILCPSQDKISVQDDINDMVKSGKMTQAVADSLIALAKKNVTPEEYAAYLDELVRQGKITPEQARALLEKYKKQYANGLVDENAKKMDAMIKSGELSVTAANELLELQKKGLTPDEYAKELQRMVKEGKLSQQAADKLLGQYSRQTEAQAAKKNAYLIGQMAKNGQISPTVAKTLLDLQSRLVPLDQYAAQLDQLVKEGKMTPETAAKLLALYKALKQSGSVATCLEPLLNKGPESVAQLERLMTMQANNVTLVQYTDELKRGVQAGLVTPDMAACALQQYQVVSSAVQFQGATVPTIQANIPGAQDFAALQQRVQQQTRAATMPGPDASAKDIQQFNAAQAQVTAETEEARRQRIETIRSAMASQAQSLLTAWQPPSMMHMGGQSDDAKTKKGNAAGTGSDASSDNSTGTNGKNEIKHSLIKAGTIYFATLDTTVDSDYPDTPVMATIIDGPFKGSKLIGKLSLAQGKDRLSINFTSMDKEEWPETKNISAFAIDPDTARTVMASSVDYHYLKRYGAMMASAFVQGYASAVTQEGTSTTGIFGTSTDHPALSPGEKIAVGIGQVGTTMGQAIASYINTPVTVKVNSGVGIGILFTSAVTE